MPKIISPTEAKRRIDAGALLIDIRSPDEYAGWHIPCAKNVPLTQIGRIEDACEIIFHCKWDSASASTSSRAGSEPAVQREIASHQRRPLAARQSNRHRLRAAPNPKGQP